MMELKNLHPGDELLVMPLEFRLLLEPDRKALSLWEGGRFLREYLVVDMGEGIPSKARPTRIASKFAEFNGKNVPPTSTNYRAADKIIQLANPPIQLRAVENPDDEPLPGCVLLHPQDMEEVSLLTRVGNHVEIR